MHCTSQWARSARYGSDHHTVVSACSRCLPDESPGPRRRGRHFSYARGGPHPAYTSGLNSRFRPTGERPDTRLWSRLRGTSPFSRRSRPTSRIRRRGNP